MHVGQHPGGRKAMTLACSGETCVQMTYRAEHVQRVPEPSLWIGVIERNGLPEARLRVEPARLRGANDTQGRVSGAESGALSSTCWASCSASANVPGRGNAENQAD